MGSLVRPSIQRLASPSMALVTPATRPLLQTGSPVSEEGYSLSEGARRRRRQPPRPAAALARRQHSLVAVQPSLPDCARMTDCTLHPVEASCGSADGSPPGCKLFIFNLARTVKDADLQVLFQPFSPIYAAVAIGKKGARCAAGRGSHASCCASLAPAPTWPSALPLAPHHSPQAPAAALALPSLLTGRRRRMRWMRCAARCCTVRTSACRAACRCRLPSCQCRHQAGKWVLPTPTLPAGKEMDLKFAVALADPDPSNVPQPQLHATPGVRQGQATWTVASPVPTCVAHTLSLPACRWRPRRRSHHASPPTAAPARRRRQPPGTCRCPRCPAALQPLSCLTLRCPCSTCWL